MRCAVFLRAVNLGARRRFPMATFRDVLERAGCSEVRTLLASGQAVVTASGDPRELATRLRPLVEAAAGFEVPLVVLTAGQLRGIARANPFADEPDPTKVHALLVQEGPAPEVAAQLADLPRRPGERLAVVPHAVYLHVGDSFRTAKLPARVSKLLECTARNVATLAKVVEALGPATIERPAVVRADAEARALYVEIGELRRPVRSVPLTAPDGSVTAVVDVNVDGSLRGIELLGVEVDGERLVPRF